MSSKPKFLTQKELEKLVYEKYESSKFVRNKKAAYSDHLLDPFHRVFVENVQ